MRIACSNAAKMESGFLGEIQFRKVLLLAPIRAAPYAHFILSASLLRTPWQAFMRNIISLVLGGGRGTRLYPLTKYRSKPAVPLAAKYRLIDIPLSNCINSGLNRMYVLTQFLSVSLHRHLRQTYRFDNFSGGFVELLAAQQISDDAKEDWYQGTADAVRKNLRYLTQPGVDYVLILSGDQLYRMDFREMLRTHQECGCRRHHRRHAGGPADGSLRRRDAGW